MTELKPQDIRVLHIVDKLVPASGVASVIMNLVEYSDCKQDVVAYSDIDPSMKERVEKRGGRVYKVTDIRADFGKSFKCDISAVYEQTKYSVVHGHLLNSAYIYMKEAKKRGVPVRVIHSHSANTANSMLKRIRNDALKTGIPRWANVFIAGSEKAAQRALGNRSVHIVRNGIDTERFKYNNEIRTAVRNELGIKDKDICIGSVARFSPEKNHQFMFKVLENTPDAVGVFAGVSGMPDAVNVPRNVKFIGMYDDISRLYQAFDVFVLPSLFEGFPVVAVEAQCAGLPCLISDSITEEVDFSGNVTFLPIDDPNVWAAKILEATKRKRTDGSEIAAKAGMDIRVTSRIIEKLWRLGE